MSSTYYDHSEKDVAWNETAEEIAASGLWDLTIIIVRSSYLKLDVVPKFIRSILHCVARNKLNKIAEISQSVDGFSSFRKNSGNRCGNKLNEMVVTSDV